MFNIYDATKSDEPKATTEPKKFTGFDFKWDEKFLVSVEPNSLPVEAVKEIQDLVNVEVGGNVEWKYFDWSWQVEEGQFTGKLPNRISAYLYKQYNRRLTDAIIGRIGDVAKRHMPSSGNTDVVLCFTKKLDWKAGTFGDGTSCFWQSRRGDRESIKSNNGLAVQAWNPKDWKEGKARVWAAFIEKDKVLVVYNAYGTLPITEFARALSIHYGCSYKYMNLRIGSDVVFVNSNNCYVIGAKEDIDKLYKKASTDNGGMLILPYKRKVMCFNCHNGCDDAAQYDGKQLCAKCWKAFVKTCTNCRKHYWITSDSSERKSFGSKEYISICGKCKANHCINCGEFSEKQLSADKNSLQYRKCEKCTKESDKSLIDMFLAGAR